MTRFFNKFGKLAAVIVLAGVAVPQAATAGHHGNGGGNGGSHRSQNFMKSSGSQFSMKSMNSQPLAIKNFNTNDGTFARSNGNSLPTIQKFNGTKISGGISTQNLSSRKITTTSGTVLNSGKYTPSLLN